MHAERMARFEAADLYVVITQDYCGERSTLEVLDLVLRAGVRIVQLREKHLSTSDFYELAVAFRERTLEDDALLIINDRVDIALATAADGVHLGLDDLPVLVARTLAPDLLIGASCHGLDEALAAEQAGASYVNIGPIFDTSTKAVATGSIGPEAIDAIRPYLTVPWSTMGGIKLHNIDAVLDRGARHPAVVTAVTAAPNPEEAASQLRAAILLHRESGAE
jgi:thiamine-phosphate pyrophosphorylase